MIHMRTYGYSPKYFEALRETAESQANVYTTHLMRAHLTLS